MFGDFDDFTTGFSLDFFFSFFFFRSGGLGAARRFTFPMLPMIFLSRQVDRNPVPYVFHGFPLALVV